MYQNTFKGLKVLQVGMIMTITSIVLMLGLLEIGLAYKFGGANYYSFFDNNLWHGIFYFSQLALAVGAVLRIAGLHIAAKSNKPYKAVFITYLTEVIAVGITFTVGLSSSPELLFIAYVFFVIGTLATNTFTIIAADRLYGTITGTKGFLTKHRTIFIIICAVGIVIMPVICNAILLHKVKGIKTFDDWVRFEADHR